MSKLKRYSLNLGEDGRILSATKPEYLPSGVMVDELPEGDISNWLYINGEYEWSPLPDPPDPGPTPEERIAELESIIDALIHGEIDE